MGGLLFSQLITLYITPVVYTYLDPYNKRVSRRLARDERAAGAGEQIDWTAGAVPGTSS